MNACAKRLLQSLDNVAEVVVTLLALMERVSGACKGPVPELVLRLLSSCRDLNFYWLRGMGDSLLREPEHSELAGDGQFDPARQFLLPAFLKLAGDPTNFSQAPYRTNDNGLGLITTNAVARWLTGHYEEDGGYLAGDVSVSDVVEAGAELRDRLELKKKSLRVVDALTILAGGRDTEPPAAIVITETGHCHEVPLGIITASDTPALTKALGV
jgi:hypothetical protein